VDSALSAKRTGAARDKGPRKKEADDGDYDDGFVLEGGEGQMRELGDLESGTTLSVSKDQLDRLQQTMAATRIASPAPSSASAVPLPSGGGDSTSSGVPSDLWSAYEKSEVAENWVAPVLILHRDATIRQRLSRFGQPQEGQGFGYLGLNESQLEALAQVKKRRGMGLEDRPVVPAKLLRSRLHPWRLFEPMGHDRYSPADLLPKKGDEEFLRKRRTVKKTARAFANQKFAQKPVLTLAAENSTSQYNTEMLAALLSKGGQISPRRFTHFHGLTHQKVAKVIRRARQVALLPTEGWVPDFITRARK